MCSTTGQQKGWVVILPFTHIIVDAFGRGASSGNHVIVIPVVDQEQSTRAQALLKVTNGRLLLALVPEVVVHVGEGVAQANDGIESISNHGLDVVVQRQPVGLLNDYGKRSEWWN